MKTVWYSTPVLTKTWRSIQGPEHFLEGETHEGIIIEEHTGNTNSSHLLGLNGGLTLEEAEDLRWRVKQGGHLRRYGFYLSSLVN